MLPIRSEMHHAFLASDHSYDGVFFTAVRTTGIFCRPSCSARKPLPENVEFFGTVREAILAGYRPCKRCRPLDTGASPEWVRRLLDLVEREPEVRFTDADLRQAGFEPARVRRYFRQEYGMTFQAYCRGRRLSGSLEQIRRGAALDDVVFDTGYESHSGFREAFEKAFGRPPGKSRDAECVVTTWVETPLGPMVAGATRKGVCLLEFTDRRMLRTQLALVQKRFGCPVLPGESPHLSRLQKELGDYFAGERRQFTAPLVYPGTPFEEAVWKALLEIPYGDTWSYEDLARRVGRPGASRAVGGANGRNRIAIVIPCHRVVNKSGELGGYGGGKWRKQKLLDLEQAKTRPYAASSTRSPARPGGYTGLLFS
jgi:AraC family transcriptional regulator of adaptative response/methylated-DNA-[protein]-cysteine methyltransferase